jgi:ribosomal protein S18 acetylase RimI-like enzyme
MLFYQRRALMPSAGTPKFSIRKARTEEFSAAGQMAVEVYANLAGMPTLAEQPEYYNRLRDVGVRASNPAISVYVAVSEAGRLLASVDFIDDMKHYGSGGSAGTVPDAAGVRLLAVRSEFRRMGIGKHLTQFCIERALSLGRSRVILHTTRAMQTAWGMYERMGFNRFPEIDFMQGNLEVFGFQLDLVHPAIAQVPDGCGKVDNAPDLRSTPN